MASQKTFFAIIAGVGPGTGRATALRFARTYPVALLARSSDSYGDLVREIRAAGGQAVGVSADTSDAASVERAFASIRQQWAPKDGFKLAAAVFNVGAGFAIKPFLEVTAEELNASLVGNAWLASPELRRFGRGREFGPKGVHVAHVIIDGAIDTPRLREIGYKANDGAPDGLISPDAIADTYWHLHTQHRSAFTQEVDLRPYVEKF
ncbi:oxidoreductase [Magnaporthiopsis poae ATCC 64411]|uniref:Oxidoreductase n=1 Tax=Magnaporthiopsis poae (strain ATCC 64411 / 73-15) TaxID=644358 RepID=A0A0C4DJY3_MAGP6|nr:oxidoreductase [Magnaporthiopsis poae ATCC 64411]